MREDVEGKPALRLTPEIVLRPHSSLVREALDRRVRQYDAQDPEAAGIHLIARPNAAGFALPERPVVTVVIGRSASCMMPGQIRKSGASSRAT
jgi:hypothetical protein